MADELRERRTCVLKAFGDVSAAGFAEGRYG